MCEENLCYITFQGVTQVLKAEKVLPGKKNLYEIVPIPREITADCGVCIMCAPENVSKILNALCLAQIVYENVYTLKKKQKGLLMRLLE